MEEYIKAICELDERLIRLEKEIKKLIKDFERIKKKVMADK